MLNDLLNAPQEFLAHGERFATSVIFSAVYGVRLAQLDHPIMKEFYSLWEAMLEGKPRPDPPFLPIPSSVLKQPPQPSNQEPSS